MTKVKLLSPELHKAVLGWTPVAWTARATRAAQDNWDRFGLSEATDNTEVINLPYPEGLGTYEEVLEAATSVYGVPVLDRLTRLSRMGVPELPEVQPGYRPGWQRYEGDRWVPSGCPQGDMVLDFETAKVTDHLWLPVCCGVWCVGPEGAYWYLWQAKRDQVLRGSEWVYDLPRVIEFTEGNVVVGHNCVPLSTEALTQDGWKVITEVKPGDKVLGYQDGEQVWTEVKAYVDGGIQEVVKFGNAHRSYRATKGHRWLTQVANGHREFSSEVTYQTTEALERSDSRRVRILNAQVANFKSSVWTPDEAALVAWVWSDGSLNVNTGNGGVTYFNATITQKKQFGQDAIEALLGKLGIRISYHAVKSCGSRRYYIPADTIRELYQRAELDFEDPHHYTKLVCKLSSEALTAWLDAFVLAEGTVASFNTGAVRLSQCPKANPGKCDAILAAAQILGYNPSVSGKSITLSKRNTTSLRKVSFESEGLQPVGCLRTTAGNWVMRQGTEITLTGNCPYDRKYLATEYPMADSGNRFFDTMAAWIASRGMGNQQRVLYKLAERDGYQLGWDQETATNSLKEVYNWYTGRELDKSVRDGIEKASVGEVMDMLDQVSWYCLKDVRATFEVFSWVYPEWTQDQPSLVSQTAQILLGNTWLPLSSDRFPGYYDRAELTYQQTKAEITQRLLDIAHRVAQDGPGDNPQLAQLDWTPGRLKVTPDIRQRLTDDHLDQLVTPKGSSNVYLVAPKWYRQFLKDPKIKSRLVPLFLQVTWRGQPVLWEDGWVAGGEPIPHPEKRGERVTDLLAKGFSTQWEDGTLASSSGNTSELTQMLASTINWVSLRARVASIYTDEPEGYPVCLPQITVTGTITRRCADSTWQVASNPKAKRIGTELKSMIEAPEGWSLVGADVDSEELWIASAFGDTAYGYCGASALGLMTIIGDKKQGSDVHSATARKASISRDLAKNFVYGAIYGLGLKGATDYLLKALPGESEDYCRVTAQELQNGFKGRKSDYTGRYVGGLASEFFNYAETLANSRVPETPVLKARISKALRDTRDFKTTKVNWTVQSSGSDVRDIYILVSTYLFEYLGIPARLLMSIHDEFRFIVKEGYEHKAAYALQITHLIFRAAFIDALALDGIPANIAWHSAIDVDKVIRKEPTQTCITPSQPEAIPPGYMLSPSELHSILTSTGVPTGLQCATL